MGVDVTASDVKIKTVILKSFIQLFLYIFVVFLTKIKKIVIAPFSLVYSIK